MNLLDFLNENYYMMVPALWVIGYALKQTPNVPDWSIIWILVIISVFSGGMAFGLSLEGLLMELLRQVSQFSDIK